MELNKNVTVIPAQKRVGNTVTKEEKAKLRIAAYCRVSTDSDEQASSYEVQVEITPSSSRKIRNGSWRAYLRMTGSAAVIQKNAVNLTA